LRSLHWFILKYLSDYIIKEVFTLKDTVMNVLKYIIFLPYQSTEAVT